MSQAIISQMTDMKKLTTAAVSRLEQRLATVRAELGKPGLISPDWIRTLGIRCHLAELRLAGAFAEPMLKIERDVEDEEDSV